MTITTTVRTAIPGFRSARTSGPITITTASMATPTDS